MNKFNFKVDDKIKEKVDEIFKIPIIKGLEDETMEINYIAGLDISYSVSDSDFSIGAITILEFATLKVNFYLSYERWYIKILSPWKLKFLIFQGFWPIENFQHTKNWWIEFLQNILHKYNYLKI